MSHLQPNFIAKNKARAHQAKGPHRMPDNMIRREASRYPVQDWMTGRIRVECTFYPDHRVFVLKK